MHGQKGLFAEHWRSGWAMLASHGHTQSPPGKQREQHLEVRRCSVGNSIGSHEVVLQKQGKGCISYRHTGKQPLLPFLLHSREGMFYAHKWWLCLCMIPFRFRFRFRFRFCSNVQMLGWVGGTERVYRLSYMWLNCLLEESIRSN